MTTRELKARENRARRLADRKNLILSKSRRRDPEAQSFGRFWLVNDRSFVIFGGVDGALLSEIEGFLNEKKETTNDKRKCKADPRSGRKI